MYRQEAEDLLTTAAAVAAARAQASADEEEADIAPALTAVCQVATNALEVRALHLLCALLRLIPYWLLKKVTMLMTPAL